MFTGIVTAVGRVIRAASQGQGTRLEIEPGRLPLSDLAIGDSLAVNGVCLTLVDLAPGCLATDLGRETLGATTFGRVRAGDPVNLEKALRLSDRLGGHLLSGHVDGIGTV
ncbi:MAG: riboflavin synthase, partial [Gammaproteobacteria bacterium]